MKTPGVFDQNGHKSFFNEAVMLTRLIFGWPGACAHRHPAHLLAFFNTEGFTGFYRILQDLPHF